MMKTAIAALALIVAPGCSQDDMDMSHSLGEAGDHLQGLTAESANHRLKVGSAGDLNAVLSQEGEHYDRTMMHMNGMMGNMNDMRMCRHSSGGGPELTAMRDHIEKLRAECSGHRDAMAKATDMPAAMAEEARHQTAMTDLMGRMGQTFQGMMGQAASYSCPMHGGH